MKRRTLLAAAVAAAWPAAAFADEKPAPAPAHPFAELSVLHATHGTPEVDPRLRDLEELTKPPFST